MNTRICPTWNGLLHPGNVFNAALNWAWAKAHGGTCFVYVDLDQADNPRGVTRDGLALIQPFYDRIDYNHGAEFYDREFRARAKPELRVRFELGNNLEIGDAAFCECPDPPGPALAMLAEPDRQLQDIARNIAREHDRFGHAIAPGAPGHAPLPIAIESLAPSWSLLGTAFAAYSPAERLWKPAVPWKTLLRDTLNGIDLIWRGAEPTGMAILRCWERMYVRGNDLRLAQMCVHPLVLEAGRSTKMSKSAGGRHYFYRATLMEWAEALFQKAGLGDLHGEVRFDKLRMAPIDATGIFPGVQPCHVVV